MRRSVTLVAGAMIVLVEGGWSMHLGLDSLIWAVSPHPCPSAGGCQPVAYFYAVVAGLFFIVCGLALLIGAALLVVWPHAITWTCALITECFLADLPVSTFLIDLAAGRLDGPQSMVELLVLPVAAMLLLLAPTTRAACFR